MDLMFTDGLIDRVDIYLCSREAGRTIISAEPIFTDVPCRIIRDEKVLFDGDLPLADGTVLKNELTGVRYEVKKSGIISKRRGMEEVRHSSYSIRIKHESAR